MPNLKMQFLFCFHVNRYNGQVTRSVHEHGKLIIENFVLIKEVSVIAIRAINH